MRAAKGREIKRLLLLFTKNKRGFKNIAAVITEREGWARFGYPEKEVKWKLFAAISIAVN